MTPRQAAGRVKARLEVLNIRERKMGFPPLHEGSHSWPAIVRELQVRVGHVGLGVVRDERPSMESLEALGVWVLVAMQVLDEHESFDVLSGDEELAA